MNRRSFLKNIFTLSPAIAVPTVALGVVVAGGQSKASVGVTNENFVFEVDGEKFHPLLQPVVNYADKWQNDERDYQWTTSLNTEDNIVKQSIGDCNIEYHSDPHKQYGCYSPMVIPSTTNAKRSW